MLHDGGIEIRLTPVTLPRLNGRAMTRRLSDVALCCYSQREGIKDLRLLILLLSLLSIPFLSNGQIRTITEKVTDEFDLTPMPEVRIHNRDTVLLGTTDAKGDFNIELTTGMDELLLTFIGMELTSVKVPVDCNHAEIIMMVDVIYDFITLRKENRKAIQIIQRLT